MLILNCRIRSQKFLSSLKSIIRFSCILKSWNSIITSSSFINSQLTQSLPLLSNSIIYVKHCDDRTNFELYKLIHDDNNKSFDQFQEFEFPPTSCHFTRYSFIGSINGLFCLNELESLFSLIGIPLLENVSPFLKIPLWLAHTKYSGLKRRPMIIRWWQLNFHIKLKMPNHLILRFTL